MFVFYYQWPETGKTYCICVRGAYPTSKSPIWSGCNTSVLMVPGTEYDTEEDEDE
jgi:hypothetical protein